MRLQKGVWRDAGAMAGGDRLVGPHINGGAYATGRRSVEQIVEIHNARPAGQNNNGAGPHGGKITGVNAPGILRGGRGKQKHDGRPPETFVERGRDDARLAQNLRMYPGITYEDFPAKGFYERQQGAAQVAKADNGECFPERRIES